MQFFMLRFTKREYRSAENSDFFAFLKKYERG